MDPLVDQDRRYRFNANARGNGADHHGSTPASRRHCVDKNYSAADFTETSQMDATADLQLISGVRAIRGTMLFKKNYSAADFAETRRVNKSSCN